MTVCGGAARIHRWATALLVGTALGSVLGSVAIGTVAPAGAAPDRTKVAVRYDLTGSAVAGYVTYQTTSGQAHATDVPLPWSVRLTGSMTNATSPTPYSLSAQSVGPGVLTCTIRVNDTVVSQHTATGNPARVLCENHGQRS